MKIKSVHAREVLDSRGNPTIETDLLLENGMSVRASVPSGASTGSNEALELRDGGHRYLGKGVLQAVANVNDEINHSILGMELNQKEIDEFLIKLDGTKNKSRLGANALLSVSLCVMKAIALLKNEPLYKSLGDDYKLPTPMMNIINGGVHASSGLEFQEFMIIPQQEVFAKKLRCASEVFHNLQAILKEKGYPTSVGDEGGFAPQIRTIDEAFELILDAIIRAGYKPGIDVFLGIDAAASEFFDGTYYTVNKTQLTKKELIDYYVELTTKYPLISIEDAFSEDDIDSIKILTDKIGDKVMLVGDDYFVTNKLFLQKGIDEGYNNAILLKANQIGTITEMIETINLAKEHKFKTIISHRSGETEDTFIADMAVGLKLDYIKTGSLCRGERISKYNQLLRIEEEIFNNK